VLTVALTPGPDWRPGGRFPAGASVARQPWKPRPYGEMTDWVSGDPPDQSVDHALRVPELVGQVNGYFVIFHIF
jgi:hypothetical protein